MRWLKQNSGRLNSASTNTNHVPVCYIMSQLICHYIIFVLLDSYESLDPRPGSSTSASVIIGGSCAWSSPRRRLSRPLAQKILVYHGMLRYVTVCLSYAMVSYGMLWYILWYSMLCCGMLCGMLWGCSCMLWYVMVCYGIFWYVMVCSGISWYVVVYMVCSVEASNPALHTAITSKFFQASKSPWRILVRCCTAYGRTACPSAVHATAWRMGRRAKALAKLL